MSAIVVFKGGSMDGIEITYETCCKPDDKETMIIQSDYNKNNPIGYWLGSLAEVYVLVSALNSWVYDHESEVVEEDK
ncbi:hypothetical protein LCGC14_2862990 [marine sediment metagenome]|uniref:Uncharacterized protein n=1 Tax=marine sediment metagenome TaxID=412755 RepID=A0A0F8Y5E3_9ZZZZ